MKLADLAISRGTTLGAVASRCEVSALLLSNIDRGRQAMPRELASKVASVLKVSVGDVKAACPLNIDSSEPVFLNAIPPFLGEPIPPARLAPTEVVVQVPVPEQTTQIWAGVDTDIGPDPSFSYVEAYARRTSWARKFQTLPVDSPILDSFTIAWLNFSNTFLRVGGDEVWGLFRLKDVLNDFPSTIVKFNNAGVAAAKYQPYTDFPGAIGDSGMALDPASPNVWTCGETALHRTNVSLFKTQAAIDLVTLWVDDGFSGNPCAILFPGDGFGYALCDAARFKFSDGHGMVKFDPTPGFEAVVLATPNPDPAADPSAGPGGMRNINELVYVPTVETFYNARADGSGTFSVFDKATLTQSTTAILETTAEIDLHGTIDMNVGSICYVPATDRLWFIAYETNEIFGTRWRLIEASRAGGNATKSITVPLPDNPLSNARPECVKTDGVQLFVLVDDDFEEVLGRWIVVYDAVTGTMVDTIDLGQAQPDALENSRCNFDLV